METAHVIWDWNGTILQDDGLGRRIMNEMLARRSLPRLTRNRYRELLTFPIIDYYRAVGLDLERESFEDLAVEWIAGYEANWRECVLEPGIIEVLETLRKAGLTQSILSANRHERLLEQVAYYELVRQFGLVTGIPDDLAYGKEHLAEGHCRTLGISPKKIVYVGDTLHDAQTADVIGCRCILVSWGHQSTDRLASSGLPMCHHPSELVEMLGL